MEGVLLGAFIRAISVWRVFYWGLLLERCQYGGCFTGTLIRAISVRRVSYWGLLLERSQYGGSSTRGFY